MMKFPEHSHNFHIVKSWVDSIILDRDYLWSIPLSHSTFNKYQMGVNKSWLEKQVPIHRKVPDRDPKVQEQLDRIITAMIKLGVILEKCSSSENEARRQLLFEYYQLSDNERRSIPSRDGKPLIGAYIHTKAYRRFLSSEAVKQALKTIKRDHREVSLPKRSAIVPERKARQHHECYIKPIGKWIKKVDRRRQLLWEIPIVKSSRHEYRVSAAWAKRAFNLTDASYRKLKDLINTVIPIMIKERVIVVGESASALNARRKLYIWFSNLTIDQKLELPVFNNKVSYKHCLKEVLETSESLLRSVAVREVLKDIHTELIGLRVLEPAHLFVGYKQRRLGADKNFHEIRRQESEFWKHLSTLSLGALKQFPKEPFIEIQYLFAQCIKHTASVSHSNSLKDCYYKFVEYLKLTRGEGYLKLSSDIDEFILLDYFAYLQQCIIERKFSPSYANGLLSGLRRALKRIDSIGGVTSPTFLETGSFYNQRTTDRYKPFEKEERISISEAIQSDLQLRRKFLPPYEKSMRGCSPLDSDGKVIHSLATEENAKWLFENTLGQKVVNTSSDSVIERSFVSILTRLGGVHQVYSSWGVASQVDIDFILPYALRLAQVTGLNLESLMSLKVDSFVDEHEVTGKPCLRYWKERSTGDKEYHFDSFDLIHAKVGWLTKKQAIEVKGIFDEVTQLTSRIRESASDVTSKYLFIYERCSCGPVSYLSHPNLLYSSLTRFSQRHKLLSNDKTSMQLNFARFRPTFVSELVELGATIRDIQILLGHKNFSTTVGYLERLDLNRIAKEEVRSKLKHIHNSALESNGRYRDEFQTNKRNPEAIDNPNVIFMTPLSSCRNIFDPPDHIKRLKSYIPGTPCQNYNRCLSCDNVIITASKLPELFALQRGYSELLQRNQLSETPYFTVVHENMSLLEAILDPQQSEFSVLELEEARKASIHIDTSVLVDGVVL
ncbi:hypothetical protein L1D54_01415 [Vibrio brasiliensis]|nr:hypothetical protein [Vibrio brasiliensis]MCG9749135.1 hypothetical protein [Vibrio brasiliensis]